MGPNRLAALYRGYFVNGYAFRNRADDTNRATSHSGVCLKGNDLYYGVLREVVELEYLGPNNKVVLFRCDWFDSVNGVLIHDTYNIVDVDTKSKHRGDDVFIMASQAEQAYFAPYPQKGSRSTGRQEWCAVWKTKARRNIDVQYVTSPGVRGSSSLDLCFQENDMPIPPVVMVDDGVEEDEEIENDGEEDQYQVPDPTTPPTTNANTSQFIDDSANAEFDELDTEHEESEDEANYDSETETEDEFEENEP
jgi:hypothetical protein